MKLPIKHKKDWFIASIITFIALYYISMYYDFRIMSFMMRFSPDKMNLMNYPGGWGNLALVGFIMTLLLVGIMVVVKKKLHIILITGGLGILFTVFMFLGFIIHTNLIVGTSKTLSPTSIWISCFDKDINIHLDYDTDRGKEFTKAAKALEAEAKSVQKELKSQTKMREEETYHIWISYPQKYGQSYDLILYVQGDRIYSYHGTGDPESRVFYKDSGFRKLLQNIVEQNK